MDFLIFNLYQVLALKFQIQLIRHNEYQNLFQNVGTHTKIKLLKIFKKPQTV
ncbi:hypothetical protein LEP1GSC079_0953 [Leptospira interrogans str. FPW1039]|uniref:Uncharacterized protein n=2 Tax=Leptospira interrogans TaxID=173 RepID=A0A0E2D8F6_LEPIR|nr:hypothetical protein LEP1GSC045_0967 [Leptospira interrogans serovar Pomona str. Kennewicki LC82-25]EKN96667.1 hypothetical protein LEP1GSC014_3740 [Leptospira interrogans serovar Pomona str. Pomona]EKO68904.1 hypothetical protein LEP1GSC069_4011 [Leptospira interrogans serovar Canicola str. Fiocruz LV133]EKR36336.1 hypothetical protein LEP1GSC096_4416 [Leptospira interrogans serovar Hebdomadis str. R499]EKR56360.1 hypothetical protein LEP1GSC105_3414 [Leptospira interrogans str. UI 12758]E